MKTLKNIYPVLFVMLISLVLINAASNEDTSKTSENISLNFCGEGVPLEIPDVWERYDKEMTINKNLHASTELVIKRANRYFPVMEPILAKYGVPDDFKYLAVIESKLENAVS